MIVATDKTIEAYGTTDSRRYWIYVLCCTATGRKYVGRTYRIAWRYKDHMFDLRNNRHPNILMQQDFNTYGANSFEYYVVANADVSRHAERDFMIKLRTYDESVGYNKYDPCMWARGKPTRWAKGEIPKDYFVKFEFKPYEYRELGHQNLLTEKERLYYQDRMRGETYQAIAKKYGVSRQCVCDLTARAVRKLKEGKR